MGGSETSSQSASRPKQRLFVSASPKNPSGVVQAVPLLYNPYFTRGI